MNITKISQSINNYSKANTNVNVKAYKNTSNIAFCGIPVVKNESKIFKSLKDFFKPVKNIYDEVVEEMAKGIGNLLNTEFAINTLDKSKRKKLLMNHLMTFGSVILSGFYVIRTLGNKDLEEKKKKTLAINQAAVFGLSTVLCYTLDGLLNKGVSRFTNRFEVVNAHIKREVLEKCVKGMPTMKTVGVFDIIYRLIAPVMITPIANHIGNKMNDKKEAELATKKQA